MTSPALERMAARAALPITVDYRPYEGGGGIFRLTVPARRYSCWSAESASGIYFNLVASLESSPTTSDQR